QENVHRAVGEVDVSGDLALTDISDLEWNNLLAGEHVITRGTFRIEDLGDGEIKASIMVLDETGQVLYGRSSALYFLVTEDQILTGSSSPMLLKIEHLKTALNSGAITQEEYEEALEEVLGGGAKESN
ncbi:MAG: hypothetical protein V3U68_07175, partial [Bacteroidota bacterium]